MVDLSKAKPGDTVTFRCGGTAVIDNITEPSLDVPTKKDRVYLAFKGFSWGDEFMLDGHKYEFTPNHPMDIISITKAFDWNLATWGQAFIGNNNQIIYHYLGKSPFSGLRMFMQKTVGDKAFTFSDTEGLTRAPEHDVEAIS